MLWWSIVFLVFSIIGWVVVGLVALRDAKSGERRRAALEAAVARERADVDDVVLVVRPAWRLFVRTSEGISLVAYTDEAPDAPPEHLAGRLVPGLRSYLLDPEPTRADLEEPDGPLSSRRPIVFAVRAPVPGTIRP